MWSKDAMRILQGATLVLENMARENATAPRSSITQLVNTAKDVAAAAREQQQKRQHHPPLLPSVSVGDAPAETTSLPPTQPKHTKAPSQPATCLPSAPPPPALLHDTPKRRPFPTFYKSSDPPGPSSAPLPPRQTEKDTVAFSPQSQPKFPTQFDSVALPPSVPSRARLVSKEQSVPSTPLARVLGFGGLAARLAVSGMYEAVRRQIVAAPPTQSGSSRPSSQTLLSDTSAEHIAETLCKMRGAALKLGQMLSLQDEGLLPEPLAKALERVRQGADIMPRAQLHSQLVTELGVDWRARFAEFDETPVAAASIGQVHRGRTLDGREVAVKVQYPGVADSIDSDLRNLQRLVTYLNVLPPGLYVDEILDVAREELTLECDYRLEAQNQQRFQSLVSADPALAPHVLVPGVVEELSSRLVLTSDWVDGEPIDRVATQDQATRNRVARLVLLLTLRELFAWRFMQTDPNWSNFLYNQDTGKLSLLDFGASRNYDKKFVDKYLGLVWSAANQDTTRLMEVSRQLGFLTGDESPQMLHAHERAGLVVGEPFVTRGAFDFYGSNMTLRISKHGETFMKHRLTPPPREAYSLHRKLAGAFLLCIKLKAVMFCRDLLEEAHGMYDWEAPQEQEMVDEEVASGTVYREGVCNRN
ncbi:atypical abc1 abc1-a protein kinase [Nannochloropsis oceanica]